MTSLDQKNFAIEMARLAEGYQSPLSSARIQVYFDALDEFELADLTVVMRESIKRRKFFPKVAEIRHDVKERLKEQQKATWVREEKPRLSCFSGIPCEECETLECSCDGCKAVIAKCQSEIEALKARIASRFVTL